MKKCRALSEKLLKRHQERANLYRLPRVHSQCREDGGEGYEILYQAGTLHVKADSPYAEACALSLLDIVIPSGHWHEFLGVSHPKFPLRSLWLQKPVNDSSSLERICQRAIELGYNAIAWDGSGSKIPREYGLKTIYARNSIEDAAAYDYLLWRGTLPQANHKLTLAELFLLEISRLEKMLPKPTQLIYEIPYDPSIRLERVASLLLTLEKEVASGTILAFPLNWGKHEEDHAPEHPVWEVLRESRRLQKGSLLPVFNAGGIDQGEGLWPSIGMDLAEKAFSYSLRHPFAGGLGCVNQVGNAGGFWEANVWMWGQMMWRGMLPSLLIETWIKARKPVNDGESTLSLLKAVRSIVIILSRLRTGEEDPDSSQLLGERAAADLKWIEAAVLRMRKKQAIRSAQPTFVDYLVFFCRDAKRLVKYYVPRIQVDEEAQDSIWTKVTFDGTAKKISWLETPNSGQMNTKQAAIVAENVFA